MFDARVISGKGRGRGLGFPTLNLEIPKNFDVKEGIYACTISIDDAVYKGALHYGPIPVFGDTKKSLEIFVLDWNGLTRPENIRFQLANYLRPIRNFENPERLSAQIAEDIERIKNL